MTQSRRDPGQGSDPSTPLLIALVTVAATVLLFWLALLAGEAFAGTDSQMNPAMAVAEVLRGRREVPIATWVVFGVLLLALIAAVVAVAVRVVGRRSDRPARSMGNSGSMTGLTERDAARSSSRLRPGAGRSEAPGVFLGTAVGSRKPLYADWETCMRIMAGPRQGKTTSWAVPAILEAPGAVVATSNKGDIVKATCGGTGVDGRAVGRVARGHCWIFDPQRICSHGQATFWWNPLERVRSISDAREVAELLIDGCESISQGSAGTNAYFEGGAKKLLAIYILAAALNDGDLYHVKEWLADDTNRTAAQLLEGGVGREAARNLATAQEINPRQRDGLWDMARTIIEVLDDLDYGRWITPPRRRRITVTGPGGYGPAEHDLPQFDPAAFASSTDTLYALSREGAASAAPLLTLLVGQVFKAAERAGETSSTGRIDPPMLGVLDEAANICPLNRLPDWYSHFGSRGIVLMTFFQSPAQAQRVWGKEGFDALDSASGVKIYAGAVTDRSFLDDLSAVIGQHWISTGSNSYNSGGPGSPGGGSVQRSWQKDSVMDAAKLASIDPERAIVQSPRSAPVMIAKIPWWDRPCGREVKACHEIWDATAAQRMAPSLRHTARVERSLTDLWEVERP